jgi:hypothetical protein
VAAARGYEAEEKELRAFIDRTLARMDEDRARDGERMEALLAAFAAETPAVERLPQAQRELAASLQERSRELTEARQRYAAALASADGSSDAEAVALRQEQAADLRSRKDNRRNELALAAGMQEAGGAPEGAAGQQGDDAGEGVAEAAPNDGEATEEGAPDEAEPAAGREAEVARLRKALAAAVAREKQATAAADRSAAEVRRLKEEVAAARDADARLNPVLENRIAAEKAHEQQLAAAEKLRKELSARMTPQEPGDDAVTATRAGEDRRLYYILFAGAAIVVGFSVLMWLSAHGGQSQAPVSPYEAPPVS